MELTDPESHGDLSEFDPDGDGGTLGQGQSIDLGAAWIKSPFEDLTAELLLDDGTVEIVGITFENGPNDAPFAFGDLDFDGDFDREDFTGVFLPGFGADTDGLTTAQRYRVGDFNDDGVVDEIDFLILSQAFSGANPGAAALQMTVPEPTAMMILGIGLLLGLSRRQSGRLAAMALVVLCTTGALSTDALGQANIIAHWSFDETSGTSLADSTGNHDGTAQGRLTASANTGQIGNAWLFGAGHVDIADPDVFTTLEANYSFSMWVRTTSSGPAVMWSVSDSTAGSEEVVMRINDFPGEGTVGGAHYMGRPNVSQAVSAQAVNDDQWHHIVATQSDSGWALYVDGALSDSGPQIHSPAMIEADTVGIGRNVDTGGGQWGYRGLLDDMSIWDGPLTAEEVGELYLKGLSGVAAPDPFNAVLSLVADPDNGQVLLANDTGTDFEIDLYRITSAGDSLDPTGWNSLDDQGFDASAWTELGTDAARVSEGVFGASTVFGEGTSVSLGSLYDESVDAQDLVFEYHLAGTPPSFLTEGTVDYEPIEVVGANFDGDGDVDDDDFRIWQLGFPTFNGAGPENGDADNDGDVDGHDFLIWQSQTSAGPGNGSTSVPEPTALALVGLLALLAFSSRRTLSRRALALMVAALVGLHADAAVATNVDRSYSLGDDPAESAAQGSVVGSAVGGVSFDSAGTVGAGDLQDLAAVGDPTYVDVSGRPGGEAGALGASFDGRGDFLTTAISMNRPSDMWDDAGFFPVGQQFPHNYEGISAHGMQLWARPTTAALGNGRQGLVFDSLEHGIFISPEGTWGLWYDPDPAGGLATSPSIDSGVAVTRTLDASGWVHVMQLAGFGDQEGGATTQNGALLVNGVAVAAKAGGYDADATGLFVGAAPDPDIIGEGLDHYDGVLDDLRLFFWGNNEDEDAGDGRMGQDWGPLDLAVDNDWIRLELERLGVTHVADVNLDGQVSGDGSGPAASDDVTAFVDGWLNVRLVNGVQVGDWTSRQAGDLNYDGITDLHDAFTLHQALTAGGGGGLDFGLLTRGVPEPTAALLITVGLLATGIGLARRQR